VSHWRTRADLHPRRTARAFPSPVGRASVDPPLRGIYYPVSAYSVYRYCVSRFIGFNKISHENISGKRAASGGAGLIGLSTSRFREGAATMISHTIFFKHPSPGPHPTHCTHRTPHAAKSALPRDHRDRSPRRRAAGNGGLFNHCLPSKPARCGQFFSG